MCSTSERWEDEPANDKFTTVIAEVIGKLASLGHDVRWSRADDQTLHGVCGTCSYSVVIRISGSSTSMHGRLLLEGCEARALDD